MSSGHRTVSNQFRTVRFCYVGVCVAWLGVLRWKGFRLNKAGYHAYRMIMADV